MRGITIIMGVVLLAVTSGCAQLGPRTEDLPAYVDGYQTYINQKQAEDVIYTEAADGTNVTFTLSITGAEKVAIAGIVPQRSIMPKNPSTAEKVIDATKDVVKTAGMVYLGAEVARELGATPKTVSPEVVTQEVPVFVGPEGPLP